MMVGLLLKYRLDYASTESDSKTTLLLHHFSWDDQLD